MTEQVQQTIGVLGGGQLAMFMGDAADKLGLPIQFLIKNQNAPVFQRGMSCKISGQNGVDLSGFCQNRYPVLFESELTPLSEIKDHKITPSPFCPSIDAMAVAGNKLAQKRLFDELGLASAPYHVVDKQDWQASNESWVLKIAHGGYDGKGNYFYDPNKAHSLEGAQKFVTKALSRGVQVYAEQSIPFDREYAMLATRDRGGKIFYYPLVETVQHKGVCAEVYGPIDSPLQTAAQKAIHAIAEHLDLVGTLAVEFFSYQGELLVNEMAPRVHNSGHYSLEDGFTSQFENHLLAVTGQKTRKYTYQGPFAMLNILGPEGYSGHIAPPRMANGKLYWYYKQISTPLRKLGHINITDPNAKNTDPYHPDFQRKIKAISEDITAWRLSFPNQTN